MMRIPLLIFCYKNMPVGTSKEIFWFKSFPLALGFVVTLDLIPKPRKDGILVDWTHLPNQTQIHFLVLISIFLNRNKTENYLPAGLVRPMEGRAIRSCNVLKLSLTMIIDKLSHVFSEN